MADRTRQRRDGKIVYISEDVGDAHTNPEYSVAVREDGTLDHSMAFLRNYGPERQDQIDWHVAHGTPGAESWEIGVPV